MRQHVAFVINNYPPHAGGVERHVQSLARQLVARGSRVTVVTLDDAPGVAVEDGVAVFRLQRWLPIASVLAFPLPGTTRRLRKLLRQRGVTAVSVHTRFFPMSFVGLRAARSIGVPVVHTEHGSGFVRGVSPLIALASRMVDLTLGRFVLRSATAVLAVSESVAAFVARLSGVRAEVFHNAIDVDEWRGTAPESPSISLPAPDRTDVSRFVFLGRVVPGKGWDALLRAAEILRDRGMRFAVDILGDGVDLPRLQVAIRDRGLSELVTARGHVAGPSLLEYLRGAILVNPTTLAEGFQTSLLEALAAGGRVVTFDVPGAALLRADGAPVIIVDRAEPEPLAEAMATMAADPLPLYASDRLDSWGWAARGADYLRVVDRVTQPTAPPQTSRS